MRLYAGAVNVSFLTSPLHWIKARKSRRGVQKRKKDEYCFAYKDELSSKTWLSRCHAGCRSDLVAPGFEVISGTQRRDGRKNPFVKACTCSSCIDLVTKVELRAPLPPPRQRPPPILNRDMGSTDTSSPCARPPPQCQQGTMEDPAPLFSKMRCRRKALIGDFRPATFLYRSSICLGEPFSCSPVVVHADAPSCAVWTVGCFLRVVATVETRRLRHKRPVCCAFFNLILLISKAVAAVRWPGSSIQFHEERHAEPLGVRTHFGSKAVKPTVPPFPDAGLSVECFSWESTSRGRFNNKITQILCPGGVSVPIFSKTFLIPHNRVIPTSFTQSNI